MNDDLILLASAYLDGDVTPDERARIESDPELVAEVDRLRQVRALLGAGEPAAISMRERHLAAALGAWDRLPEQERTGVRRDQTPKGIDPATAAAASAVTATRPTSLAGRWEARHRGWMLAAAAGLVAVVGGAVVLNNVNGGVGDNTASDGATAAISTDEPAERAASEVEELAVEAVEEFAADERAEVAADAAEAPPPADAEAPPPEEGIVVLTDPAQLALFASGALEATSSPAATDAPAVGGGADTGFDVPQCPGIDIVVGPASYNGVLVVVGIDEDDNAAVANRVDDCTEIARADLR